MKRKRGFSLVETMMVVAVMALVLTGATGLTVNMIRGYKNTLTQCDADQSASAGLQHLSRDLQEAKQVTVLSPTSIRVYYPQLNADGTYNTAILDTVNTIDFYRATTAGVASTTGTALFRKPANGSGRAICKNITSLEFTSTSPSSVDITLHTEKVAGTAIGRCDMIHRAIFLRNY
jgi:prepilin-type N-terminal cleavage/methylation domain-containing protein